ncbi:MAG: single-stranded-DNA-specific exonuclease RecJ, partial [Deltaproteobacteria bacterium]|nr:single-stranded-DNA-specific exonuclease RecJ [Deltaproteobacteria bacterium]
MIGVPADYHIPNRIADGYGLHKRAIDILKSKGTELAITVDNGINAFDEIDYAKSLGIDVIITDHHEPGKKLPKACAVLNPKRPDCRFPFKELAGVGVVFNLIMALRQRLRDSGFFKGKEEPRLRDLLDIVAIGTVADVVPLIDENRIFVKFGLEELKKSSNRGISALKVISGLEPHQLNATAIAFRIAPRINAAGRIDDHNLGVRLFTTSDPEDAASIAEKLNSLNSKRQSMEEVILKEAAKLIESDEGFKNGSTVTLAKDGWHVGVIGIVASRLADAHNRPSVVIGIADGIGKGSLRSVGTYNIIDALAKCSDLLLNYGGHKHAAGITIASENISLFKKKFDEIVSSTLKESDRLDAMHVDAELQSDDITEELINELELLEPFGEGNPEPVFCLRELKVSDARIVAEKHLKLKITDDMVVLDAIGFGMGHHAIAADDILDVAFIPQLDTWRGRGSVQLKLKDMKRL